MTYRQLYACAAVLMLSIVASFGLMAYVLDIVSLPSPASVAVEYTRPHHIHAHFADAD